MEQEFDLNKVREEIIGVYKDYIKGEDVSSRALSIHTKYLAFDPFLTRGLSVAVVVLIDLAADTGVPPPTKKEAKEIIKLLEGEKYRYNTVARDY